MATLVVFFEGGVLEIDKAFGDALRAARRGRGWSQERLALEAEANRNYISLVEMGKNSPSVRMLFKLCAALGTHPETLITDTARRLERAERSDQAS